MSKILSLRGKLLLIIGLTLLFASGSTLLLSRSLIISDKTQELLSTNAMLSRQRSESVSRILAQNQTAAQLILLSHKQQISNQYLLDLYSQVAGAALFSSPTEKIIDWERSKDVLSPELTSSLVEQTLQRKKSGLKVHKDVNGDLQFLFAQYLEDNHQSRALLVQFSSQDLLNSIESSDHTSVGLLDDSGNIIFSSEKQFPFSSDELKLQKFLNSIELTKRYTADSAKESQQSSSRDWIISSTRVSPFPFYVIFAQPTQDAFSVLKKLTTQSILFFIFIFSLSIGLAFLFMQIITYRLRQLEQVAQAISTGNFEVQLPFQSQDEVGSLAAAMQTMASKIKDLVKDTIQKTRMESELKVARAVQENLLPEPYFQSQKLSGAGYYQPASECGGDLWYTFESGSSRFIAILDATGHGAGPALVTSAVRAVFTLLENEAEIKLTAVAEKLNRVIDSVSKGQILMTAFLVRLDLNTGKGEYVNCSHEQPILLRENHEDLDYLSEPVNPRLGQDLKTQFEDGPFDLRSGDRLIFYTDGVTDIKNPAGKNFGDRRFLKIIQELHQKGLSTEEFNKTLVQNLDHFSDATELPDDMTLINILSH